MSCCTPIPVLEDEMLGVGSCPMEAPLSFCPLGEAQTTEDGDSDTFITQEATPISGTVLVSL